MDPNKVIYVVLLFVFTIAMHEFTHWLALKKMGGSGKFAIIRGSFKMPTIGIRYTGGLKNWRQVLFFKGTPIPVTFVCFYYLASVIVDPARSTDFLGWFVVWVFALALTWIACNKDFFDVRTILLRGNEMNFEEVFNAQTHR